MYDKNMKYSLGKKKPNNQKRLALMQKNRWGTNKIGRRYYRPKEIPRKHHAISKSKKPLQRIVDTDHPKR